MENIYGIIYKATNKINGKIYIGQTKKSLKIRMNEHAHSAKYKENAPAFINAIKKYTINGFNWDIIDTAQSKEELNEKERYWIKFYNSLVKEGIGYNIAEGGYLNPYAGKTDDEMKLVGEKQRQLKTGTHWGHHSEESKRRISEANSGKIKGPLSKEQKEKQSNTMKQHYQDPEYKESHSGFKQSQETKDKRAQSLRGLKRSDETKLKMSEAAKKVIHKPQSEETKQKRYKSVICLNDNMKVFKSIRECADYYNLDDGAIVNRLKGRGGKVIKGYQIVYYNEQGDYPKIIPFPVIRQIKELKSGVIYDSVQEAAIDLGLQVKYINYYNKKNKPYNGYMFEYL
jgi:group I intron endonuclease